MEKTSEFPPISKAKVSLFSRLSQRKVRREEGLFIAEGAKCVADTLGRFPLHALVATPDWLSQNQTLLTPGQNILSASSQDLAKISSLKSTPEVVAIYQIPEPRPSSLVPRPSSLSLAPKDLSLLLDGIQDPGNLGTIIRTASWFGIRRIFASRQTADIYNPKTVQSTMGALADVEFIYCDLPELVRANPDIPLCILDLHGENLFTADLPESAFILMGSEGHGPSPEMKALAARSFLIPPADPLRHPDSLNVAVATAITLSQFQKSSLSQVNASKITSLPGAIMNSTTYLPGANSKSATSLPGGEACR